MEVRSSCCWRRLPRRHRAVRLTAPRPSRRRRTRGSCAAVSRRLASSPPASSKPAATARARLTLDVGRQTDGSRDWHRVYNHPSYGIGFSATWFDRDRNAVIDKPLWICPTCGHSFVTKNMNHSCARHELGEVFRGQPPHIRQLFDRFRAIVDEWTDDYERLVRLTLASRWVDGLCGCARLSVGFTTSAEQRLSTSVNERCSCFLVMLFRLQQNLPEVRSIAQPIQPRISRERERRGISTVDDVCQELHSPIFSAEMGQLSRKVVKAFRVA